MVQRFGVGISLFTLETAVRWTISTQDSCRGCSEALNCITQSFLVDRGYLVLIFRNCHYVGFKSPRLRLMDWWECFANFCFQQVLKWKFEQFIDNSKTLSDEEDCVMWLKHHPVFFHKHAVMSLMKMCFRPCGNSFFQKNISVSPLPLCTKWGSFLSL